MNQCVQHSSGKVDWEICSIVRRIGKRHAHIFGEVWTKLRMVVVARSNRKLLYLYNYPTTDERYILLYTSTAVAVVAGGGLLAWRLSCLCHLLSGHGTK
jgi:hypothetical protein